MGTTRVNSVLTSGPGQRLPECGSCHSTRSFLLCAPDAFLALSTEAAHIFLCIPEGLQSVQHGRSGPEAVTHDACHVLDLPRMGRGLEGLPPRGKATGPALGCEAEACPGSGRVCFHRRPLGEGVLLLSAH